MYLVSFEIEMGKLDVYHDFIESLLQRSFTYIEIVKELTDTHDLTVSVSTLKRYVKNQGLCDGFLRERDQLNGWIMLKKWFDAEPRTAS